MHVHVHAHAPAHAHVQVCHTHTTRHVPVQLQVRRYRQAIAQSHGSLDVHAFENMLVSIAGGVGAAASTSPRRAVPLAPPRPAQVAFTHLRHRDGGSVASSSPGESPRRQRTLGPTAFTEGDAGDEGDAGLSARDEGRRSSSDSSRASISDPARIKRTTSITRGPIAASWQVMGSETAYPSEPLLPPPAALTPRATALASALESLLHRG